MAIVSQYMILSEKKTTFETGSWHSALTLLMLRCFENRKQMTVRYAHLCIYILVGWLDIVVCLAETAGTKSTLFRIGNSHPNSILNQRKTLRLFWKCRQFETWSVKIASMFIVIFLNKFNAFNDTTNERLQNNEWIESVLTIWTFIFIALSRIIIEFISKWDRVIESAVALEINLAAWNVRKSRRQYISYCSQRKGKLKLNRHQNQFHLFQLLSAFLEIYQCRI